MAKPIFIVGIPNYEMKEYCEVSNRIRESMPDYYILTFQTKSDEPTFQAFYEKDFNEVKFEELKQIVKDSLK